MTLEEARKEWRLSSDRLDMIFKDHGECSTEYIKERQNWRRLEHRVLLLRKSPTAQLCAVAQEIARQEDASDT